MRLAFDQNAFDDLAWWMNIDSKKAKRVVSLRHGKPEPLKTESYTRTMKSAIREGEAYA